MPNPMILSCESTVDVPFSYMQERNIPVLFYNYRIDGVECSAGSAIPTVWARHR